MVDVFVALKRNALVDADVPFKLNHFVNVPALQRSTFRPLARVRINLNFLSLALFIANAELIHPCFSVLLLFSFRPVDFIPLLVAPFDVSIDFVVALFVDALVYADVSFELVVLEVSASVAGTF